MPTVIPSHFLRIEDRRVQVPSKIFTVDFLAVALFSEIGSIIALIAVFCGEQGVWL
jgi:hypothetical protein